MSILNQIKGKLALCGLTKFPALDDQEKNLLLRKLLDDSKEEAMEEDLQSVHGSIGDIISRLEALEPSRIKNAILPGASTSEDAIGSEWIAYSSEDEGRKEADISIEWTHAPESPASSSAVLLKDGEGNTIAAINGSVLARGNTWVATLRGAASGTVASVVCTDGDGESYTFEG